MGLNSNDVQRVKAVTQDAFGREIFLNAALGSDGNDGLGLTGARKTLAKALLQVRSGYNDIVNLVQSTSSLSLAANPLWTYNMTHLRGLGPAGLMNQRSRIGMSTAFTPMLTITGYGCQFSDLYFMWGTAAADLIGVQLSGGGSRNSFHRCHFNGPLADGQKDQVTKLVYINGVAETYFKDCVFGNNTIACEAASSLVYMGAGNGVTLFQNCIFLMRVKAGDTDPAFITVDNTTDTGLSIFRKCLFIAEPASGHGSIGGTPAAAIKFLGTAVGEVILDADCQFCNITNITATTTDQFIHMGTVLSSTDDDVGMIMLTPTLA